MSKLFYTLLVILSVNPLAVSAANPDQYTLLEPLPCIEGVDTGCKAGELQSSIDINSYILYVYNLALAAAVFLAIVMIIWGGFEYITSEVPFIKSDGKSKIENAIFGLIMVLVSYLILQTIDPRLVNVDSQLPAIKPNVGNIQSYLNAQADLAKKIQLTSAEDQLKISATNGEISALAKERDAIQGQMNRKEITVEEGRIKIDQINAKISAKSVDNLLSTAEAVGSQTYATAVRKMIGTSSVYPPTYLDQEVKMIESQYNALISQISSTNNTSPDKITKLINQRTFYTTQAREDLALHNLISSTNNAAGFTSKLESYKKDLVDVDKIKSSGVTESRYKDIYNSRITTLESLIKELK
jgi:flagellar biosynthesis chaperone FliJ